MKNLSTFKSLNDFSNEANAIETTYLYINGISMKYLFDENGEILKENDNPILAKTLNFSSKLTRVSESPDIFNGEEFFYIEWNRNDAFDYKGLAAICDEIVFVESSDKIGIKTGANEIRIKVRRGINNTISENKIYPENAIIRSVVNITYDTGSFSYESKSDVAATNLFAPVIDTSRIKLYQDIYTWANYNDDKIFALRRKLPLYVFSGNIDEVICDFVGFVDSFELNSNDSSIDIICKDKMSTIWNEEITAHKVYKNITIADFLSDFLDIPRNMIIYPLKRNNGVVYDSKLKLHTWQGSMYTDNHFFNIDVLATKNFETYSDLIRSATQELFFRMKYDTYERLVIQSDVFLSNEDELYDENLTDNYSTLTEDEDIINIVQTTNNQVVINKLDGEFIKRETFYDINDFLLNHLVFDVYKTSDKTSSSDRVFEEHQIFYPDSLENRTSESPFIMVDNKKKYIQVAVVLNDSNYEGKTTWYRWSVIKHQRNDSIHGLIPSVTWGWVFKDFTEKHDDESKYVFTEAVKYSKNKRIDNASIMKYDSNNVPEFSVLTQLSKKVDGKYERKYKIQIGEDIKHLKIGDNVMITDGTHDFMGRISDTQYGLTTISTPGNIIYNTEESANKEQKYTIIDPKMDVVVKVQTASGQNLTSYEFDKYLHVLTGTVSENTPYNTYYNDDALKKMLSYDDKVDNTVKSTKHFALPYPGDYSGVLTLSSTKYIYGIWNKYGSESLYQMDTTNKPNIGSVISNDGIKDSYEYRTVVTRVVVSSKSYYTIYYNVYTAQERRLVQKEISYNGKLSLNTYKYQIHVFTEKLNTIEDSNKINESTITVMCGYDKDYQLNYWGRHKYLDSLGYVDKPMDLQLFYVRNEFPYVYEYKRGDTTSTMQYPLLPAETLNFEGDFGGINIENKQFAKIVDSIDTIYGKHFGKYDPFKNEIIPLELMYSREYHVPIPVYVRFNKMTPSEDKLQYVTYDNRDVCVDIQTGVERYKELKDFLNIDNLKTAEGSKKDVSVNISNMLYGKDYKIKSKYACKAYRYTDYEQKETVSIDISADISLQVVDWSHEDAVRHMMSKEHKIKNPNNEADVENYFIKQSDCKRDFVKIYPQMVYGKKAMKVDNTSITYNVGDVIILDEINEYDIDTKVTWMKYNNARWLIRGIERNYNGEKSDLLYFDYEFPMGENNKIPVINKFSYEDIIMFQEFGLKGNPYTEEIHRIKYENVTSVDIYGEHTYDGITGKFISIVDLNTALSYIIDGFAGINKNTTKFVMPIDVTKKAELELFDIVRIDEGYYTAMNNQVGIITGIKQDFNGTTTNTTYTVFTLGRYERSNNVIIKDSSNYEPIILPEYNENGNSGIETPTNLTNTAISKYDKKLGNIMLLQISSDNLCAKNKNNVLATDGVITLTNITSVFDNTKDLKTKKYYTDTLLEKGQELFIKVGAEYIYAKVVDNTKSSQSYTEQSKIDKTINVPGIVTEATLQLKHRGVFDSTAREIQSDEKVELYQITSMANENGSYTTSMLIGNKPHREYFEFSIQDGVDITSSRGRFLVNTNEDWYLQAKDILYNYYEETLVNTMEEKDVLDYLGKGVIQIGLSSTNNVSYWKPVTKYNIGQYVEYRTKIYECVIEHTSSNIWSDDELFWEYKYSSIEYGQFLRYSPVGGLELKGKVNIDSGSFRINDIYTSNNFMHLNEQHGILGIGVGTPFFQENQELSVKSFMQVGDIVNGNGMLYYDTGLDSKFKIRTTELSIELFRPSNKLLYSSLIFEPDKQQIILNADGNSQIAKFQIGNYTGKNINIEGEHFYYESINGISDLSIKIKKGFIGNANSHIYFDEPKELIIEANWTFDSNTQRNNYFGTYDSVTRQITGGTYQGNVDFEYIIAEASKNIRHYVIVNRQYQYFDTSDYQWKVYTFDNLSMLYLNEGMQQFGNNVRDSINNFGYSGFFLGMSNASGVGDIASGQYIKFDGKNFHVGDQISLFYGNKAISFKDIVTGGADNNLEGTTTFTNNVITLYRSAREKYYPSKINNQNVIVYGDYNSNLIKTNNVFPTVTNFNVIAGIIRGRLLKFISIDDPNDYFETQITSVALDGRSFNISRIFTKTTGYYLNIEDTNKILMNIGDIENVPDTGEIVRFGQGVYYDVATDDYATGLYIRNKSNNSHFKFDSILGLNILSDNGVINLKNSHNNIIYNELMFNKYNNSYIYMNKGNTQIGLLKDLPNKLISYNNQNGFYIGSDTDNGYIAYSVENGLSMSGNFILNNGNNLENELGNINSGVNDRIDKEINNIQSLTIYSDTAPTNVIWKNIDVYKKYDIVNKQWEIIVLSTNKLDVNKLYKDNDNKYYIYNAHTKSWIPVQIMDVTSAPSQIAKTDTLWINTNTSAIYRYNPNYNYKKQFDLLYDTVGNEIVSSIELPKLGYSEYVINTSVFASVPAKLFINNVFIADITGEQDISATINAGILKSGTNILKLKINENNVQKNIRLGQTTIISTGMQKWDSSVNPQEIVVDELTGEKSSIFILTTSPFYNDIRKISGRIHTDGANTNIILGNTDTRFLTEISNGDILVINNNQYIAEKVINDNRLFINKNITTELTNIEISKVYEDWTYDTTSEEQIWSDYYDSSITVGTIVRFGEKNKIYNEIYSTRLIVSKIQDGKIYVKTQKVRRLFPYIFSIKNIREQYEYNPDIKIKARDSVYVVNYYDYGESAIFMYFPSDRNLHQLTSIMDTKLDNMNIDTDFILSSGLNDKNIFIQTNKSKLFFSSDQYSYDEINIASTGNYGRLLVGKQNSENFFYFDSELGLNLSTSKNINISGNGALNVIGGSVSVESNSIMNISSGSTLTIDSSSIYIQSNSDFIVRSNNALFDQTSSVTFRSKKFDLDVVDMTLKSNGGTILITHPNNELSFNPNGSSRIILNKSISTIQPNVVFQLGEQFSYEKNGSLVLNNAEIHLTSDDNYTSISPNRFLSKKITPGTNTIFDLEYAENEYNKEKFSKLNTGANMRSRRVSRSVFNEEIINVKSTTLKGYKDDNIIEIYNTDNVLLISESKINETYDMKLVKVGENRYIVIIDNYDDIDVQVVIYY